MRLGILAKAILSVPLVAAIAALPGLASDRGDVLKAEFSLNTAIAQHDMTSVEKLITPDYTLVLAGGKVYDRAEFLKLVADRTLTYSADTAHDQFERFYGPSTAIIVGLLDVRGQADSSNFVYRLRYTDTWVRLNGVWRRAASHCSLDG